MAQSLMYSLAMYRYDFTDGATYQLFSMTDIGSVPYLTRKKATSEFTDITKSLIYKTRNEPGGGFTFNYDTYSCHLWKTDKGLYSILISDQAYPQSEAFRCCKECLYDIVQDNSIDEVYSFINGQDLKTSCLESNFIKWSQGYTSRELQLQEELTDVKTIFCDNINSIVNLNESLDEMALKSEQLKETAFSMKKTSRRVRCHTACSIL